MLATGRYADIARQSLKENLPGVYRKLQVEGTLETFLAERQKVAAEAIASAARELSSQENMSVGSALAYVESDLIPELVEFSGREKPEDFPIKPKSGSKQKLR